MEITNPYVLRESESYGHMSLSAPDVTQYYYLMDEFAEMDTGNLIQIMIRVPKQGGFTLEFVPQLIGVLTARFLHLGRYLTIFLGELCALLAYAAVAAASVFLSPLPTLTAVIALLPMALRQGCSFSYDGFTIAMALLYFSLISRCVLTEGRISRRMPAGILVTGILLSAAKIIYAPMGLLMLCSPSKNWRLRHGRILFTALLMAGCAAGVFCSSWGAELARYAGMVESSNSVAVNYAFSDFFAHPAEGLAMLGAGMAESFLNLMGNAVGGLHYAEISPVGALLLYALSAAAAAVDMTRGKLRLPAVYRVLNVLIFLGVYLLSFVAMIPQTPLENTRIWGVQGRYLTPVLPGLMTVTPAMKKPKLRPAEVIFLTTAVSGFYLVHVFARICLN